MRKVIIATVFIMQMATLSNAQEKNIRDLRLDTLYRDVLQFYLSVYSNIQTADELKGERYESLFIKNGVGMTIPNDYWDKDAASNVFEDGASEYIQQLEGEFQGHIDSLEYSIPYSPNEMIYCKTSQCYYVWIHKIFRYSYREEENGPYEKDTVDNWIRLKIIRSDTAYKISEVVIDSSCYDYDNDHVADNLMDGVCCDNCEGSMGAGEYSLKGCLNIDLDEDGVLNKEDSCIDVKGPRRSYGCPDTDGDGVQNSKDSLPYVKGKKYNAGCPVRELIFQLDVGAALPWNGGFADGPILTNTTYNWKNSSNLALLGYWSNVALLYHFSRHCGIGAGVIATVNKFNNERLQTSTEAYLLNRNTLYDKVDVTSGNYSLLIPYIKFCLGTYQVKHHVVKIEPLLGCGMNGGFAKNNSVSFNIDYRERFPTSNQISLKTKPFIVIGATGGYEWWPVKSKLGVSLNGYYLYGKPGIGPEKFTFSDNTDDYLTFRKQPMQMLGGSLGLQIMLASGHNFFKSRD